MRHPLGDVRGEECHVREAHGRQHPREADEPVQAVGLPLGDDPLRQDRQSPLFPSVANAKKTKHIRVAELSQCLSFLVELDAAY